MTTIAVNCLKHGLYACQGMAAKAARWRDRRYLPEDVVQDFHVPNKRLFGWLVVMYLDQATSS